MKQVTVYMRVTNPRDENGHIIKYTAYFALEYKGVIKGDTIYIESDSLKNARIIALEYIFYRFKEQCDVTVRTLTKIKINFKSTDPLIKNLQQAIKKHNHTWKVEQVYESEFPIFKELKKWSDAKKRKLKKDRDLN